MEPPTMIGVDLARPLGDHADAVALALQAPPSPAPPSRDDARALPAQRASSGSNRTVQVMVRTPIDVTAFQRTMRKLAEVFRRPPRLSHHFGSDHYGPRAIDLPWQRERIERMRDEFAAWRIQQQLDEGFDRLERRMDREYASALVRLDALSRRLAAVRIA